MAISDKCKECNRKGFWIETDSNGEKLFCYKVRHDGQYHVQKLTLAEIAKELKPEEKTVPFVPDLNDFDYWSRQLPRF